LLISALSPTLTGAIIDGYGYTVAFIIVGAILGLGALTLGKQKEEQIVWKMKPEKAI